MFLIYYLTYCIINSLAMMGIYYAANTVKYRMNPETNRKEVESYLILYPFKKWAVKKLGKELSKPVITCPRCMPSVWVGLLQGLTTIILAAIFSWWLLLLLIPVIAMIPICSVLNYFIYLKLKK